MRRAGKATQVFGRLRRRDSRACGGVSPRDATAENLGHGDESLSVHDRRTNYAAGADFERKVRDEVLHKRGAIYVVRSAGSRGVADLVAFFPAETIHAGERDMADEDWFLESPVVWMIQCKRDGKISDDDRDALCALAAEVGAMPYLAWPVTEGRKVNVSLEQVSPNPNATATDILRG